MVDKPDRITFKCRKCLEDIVFSLDSVPDDSIFPVELKNSHGSPVHTLVIKINDQYRIENFSITEGLEGSGGEQIMGLQQATQSVLKGIGLTEKEIEVYFNCIGKGPMSVGEIAIISSLPNERIQEISKKFVEKGLYKHISGAFEYFQALPPYAAIIDQMGKFEGFLSTMKTTIPNDMAKSFLSMEGASVGVQDLNDFKAYIDGMSNSISSSINSHKTQLEQSLSGLMDQQAVVSQLTTLQDNSISLIDKQMNNLTAQFADIENNVTSQIVSLSERSNTLIDRQMNNLTQQFSVIETKVIKNLEKIRLGVVLKTVKEIINTVMNAELEKIKHGMQTQFINQFRSVLQDLNQQIATIPDNLKKIEDGMKNQFIGEFKAVLEELIGKITVIPEKLEVAASNIRKLFDATNNNISSTLKETQTSFDGVPQKIMESFTGLRSTFERSVVRTLNTLLSSIQNKTNITTDALKEFFSLSQETITVSLKDVWFIRSPEGMKAQINDCVSRAKMRILIVAPSLLHVDIEPILKVKSFINVRICTYIDPFNPEYRIILDQLDQHDNITYRQRDLMNLWAINKDYEECILGIVSMAELGGNKIEVAGIGSIISEHIKIFVPILEEAWMNSRKKLTAAAPISSFSMASTIKPKRGGVPDAEEKPAKVAATTVVAEPEKVVAKLSDTGIQIEMPNEMQAIVEKMETLKNSLDTLNVAQVIHTLTQIRNGIEEAKGFSKVNRFIKNWEGQLAGKPILDDDTKATLSRLLESWKTQIL